MFYQKYVKGHLLIDILNYTQEFFATCPSLTDIKEQILYYAAFEQETKDLNPTILLGPIELHTGMTFSSVCMCSVILFVI